VLEPLPGHDYIASDACYDASVRAADVTGIIDGVLPTGMMQVGSSRRTRLPRFAARDLHPLRTRCM